MKYKVYDISNELIKSKVYPGDINPTLTRVMDMNKEDLYNLSNLKMCVHNGTHIDAPLHFIRDGKSVDQIDINKFVGLCNVICFEGIINDDVALKIIKKMNSTKLLLKGNAIISEEASKVFAKHNLDLIGTELLSVGDEFSMMSVHKILLSNDLVLLEGLNLTNIVEGEYFLNCAPLNILASEGSPCRAILIKFE